MPTVDELRNEIRVAVDRFEREGSTGFTKETLAALYEAFGGETGEGRLPSRAEMRATIREGAGIDGEGAFRKADLVAIRAALDE